MGLRESIMALPKDERLPYALRLIDELSGQKAEKEVWLCKNYGLTATESKVFLALNARAPNVVEKRAIFTAVWGDDSDVEIKIVDVVVCHMRAKGIEVKTEWGVGYYLPEKVEVGEMPKHDELNRHRKWTDADDEDLILMVRNDSSLRAMAYETDRTERGVNERIRHLRKKGLL